MTTHTTVLDSFYEPAVCAALREQFTSADPRPVLVCDVLDRTLATEVVGVLKASMGWVRDYFVEEFLGGPRRVGSEEFYAASHLAQFGTWEELSLSSVDQPERGLLQEVMDVLSDAAFVACLRNLGEQGAAMPSVKIRRYGPGDFFSPHSDGNTGVGLLLYLTNPDWRSGDGGRFVYESEGTEARKFIPRFNSALVFPYRERAMHWVERMTPQAGIRYTLCFDYV